MQFTGFYDSTQFQELGLGEQAEWLKNNKAEDWKGKELWEGDIIKEVTLNKYSYVIRKENGCFKAFHLDGKLWGTMERAVELIEQKVFVLKKIGNIYENPELVKEK